MKKAGYAALDSFRLAAAFLVVANHVSPLEAFSPTADFILTRVIARVCVPFFLMTTGFFLCSDETPPDGKRLGSVMKKTAVLFGVAILLYLPLNFYNGYFENPPLRIVSDVLFNGTFYHLWYLPAVLLVLPAAWLSWRAFGLRATFAASLVLYVVGLGGDSYYGLVSQVPFLKTFYDAIFAVAGSTRLLRAPVFLLLGCMLRVQKTPVGRSASAAGLAVSAALLIAEALWLRSTGFQRSDRMYVMLLPCMYFLFSLLTQPGAQGRAKRPGRLRGKTLRDVLMLVYIIHPWCIVLIRGFARLVGMKALLVDNGLVLYVLVCAFSLALSLAVIVLLERFRAKPSETGRAWAEIDLPALRHNARELQSMLPASCRLMAVVKANAYGHGAARVAAALGQAGFRTFAVAALPEGIALRKSGVRGEILILGWTPPADAQCLRRWRLSQTVVDSGYAKALAETGQKLSVHIKVDTGMHRLGEDDANISNIESIFSYRNLTVKGMFTHLRESDDLSEEAVDFTQYQIGRFFRAADSLKEKGLDVGALHIQESYGILNYAGLPCDFARPGIALYGVLCRNDTVRGTADLRPALSLRARVAEVKSIGAGEGVGYGRNFTAAYPTRIAAVTIGYADGIPRNAAEKGLTVLIRGQLAPVVGLVCMDIMMLDVTNIAGVAPGDTVTIIGRDGGAELRCEDVAERLGTISNEVLTRLGPRLPRIYTE
jgi:serine/alanine racemase